MRFGIAPPCLSLGMEKPPATLDGKWCNAKAHCTLRTATCKACYYSGDFHKVRPFAIGIHCATEQEDRPHGLGSKGVLEEICTFLADHDRRCIGVGADMSGHDRCVDHLEA